MCRRRDLLDGKYDAHVSPMPYQASPGDQESEAHKRLETSDRLREAMLSLFFELGYQGSTLRLIAKRAGVSLGTIPYHFSSKDALLLDVAQAVMAEITTGAHEAIEAFDDPRDQVGAFVKNQVLHAAHKGPANVLADRALDHLTEPAYSELVVLRDGFQSLLTDAVERGMTAQVFAVAYPRPTIIAILQMANSVAYWFRKEGQLSPMEIGEAYAQLALRCLGVQNWEVGKGFVPSWALADRVED